MKRFYLYSLLTSLLLLCSTVASAHNFEVDGIYYNITNATAKTVKVTYEGSSYSYYSNEYSGSVNIPATVTYSGTTYSVTSISYDAFKGCSGLTSITIPSSVTSIGNDAFSGCSKLTKINVESGNTYYDSRNNCNGIIETSTNTLVVGCKNTIIPNSVTTIGGRAFYNCSSLTSINIPNSVTTIDAYAFYGCSSLTSINIPNSITTIGIDAFAQTPWYKSQSNSVIYIGNVLYKYNGNMPANTNIIINEGTTMIAEKAFYNCSGLTSITIPGSVTTIKDYAFNGCNNLKEIYFEDGEELLTLGLNEHGSSDDQGRGLFRDCPLNTIYLGRNLSYTSNLASGYSPFAHQDKLENVTISNKVERLYDWLFLNCSKLATITIPASVTDIWNNTFKGCTGLKEVHTNDLSAWCRTDFGQDYGNPLYYAKYLYLNGNKIIDLVIPNDITTIKPTAFIGICGLKSIKVDSGNTKYDSRNNCNGIIETETNTLLFGNETTKIPNDITTIGRCAFKYCTALTNIIIPNSVTKIGDDAFYNCVGLEKFSIPNSVTRIGYRAFKGCTSLKELYIEDSESSLSIDYNFYNTNYSGAIGEGAFYNSPLSTIYLGRNLSYSSDNKSGYSPFYRKKELESLTIGNNVTNIGYYEFYECSSLTNVTIPNSVKTIGRSAFENCKLTSINIPNSVTAIENYAFRGCGIREVHITDLSAWCKIDFYGYYSNPLYYAKKLYLNGEEVTNLVIPADVTEIKDYAFYNCSSLTEIYVKATTPPTIASNTFYNCSSATLYVPAGSKAAYLSADYWSEFTNIEEIIIPGDINGDIIVDVADVTMLVSAILNGEGAEETPTEQTFEDWTSTNAGVGGSTSQSSYTLEAAEGSVLTFDWSVSSESNYDWLIITIDGTQILKESGSYTGSYEYTFTAAGTHTLVAKYTKDGSVNNGSDQGKIYNIKLSGSASNKNNSTTDVDGDGTVDVADVTSLVSIILGTRTANDAPAKAAATRAGEISTVSADGDGSTLLINIDNPGYPFSAIQFDLELPEGIEVDFDGEYYAVDLGSRTNSRKHSYPECAIQPDGSLRVVIISMSNALYNGTEGDVATAALKVNGATDGDYRFTIKNVVLSAPGSKEKLAPYTGWINVTGGVTGISEIKEERAENNDIYDLQGRKVTEPVKGGIYIQNGKKVMW